MNQTPEALSEKRDYKWWVEIVLTGLLNNNSRIMGALYAIRATN